MGPSGSNRRRLEPCSGLDNANNKPPSPESPPFESAGQDSAGERYSAGERSSGVDRKIDRREIGVVLFAIVLPTAITVLYFVVLASASPSTQLLGYTTKLFQVALPWIWVVVVRREAGFRLSNKTGDGLWFGFSFGLFIGLAMLALYFTWLKSSGWFGTGLDEIRRKVLGLGVNTAGKYAVMAVFYALVHSLFEEYYWRWFVFGRMRRWSPLATAVIVSSVGFMAHHVLVLGYFFGWTNPLTYFLSMSVAVGGGVWSILYHRSGNLLGPWISHLIIDAAIFAIGYDVVRSQFAGV